MVGFFGRLWNIVLCFLRKLLDAILFGAICHYSITFIKGEEAFDISGYILLGGLALGFLISIIRIVMVARPINKNKEPVVLNRRPDAVNVKITKRSDVNVKVHRGFWWCVKNMLIIIIGVVLFSISLSSSSYDLEKHKGSWLPAVVLVAECVFYNFYVSRPFKKCKCRKCQCGKAIKLVSKELLEEKIGNWVEEHETMELEDVPVTRVKYNSLGLESYRYDDTETKSVIRTHQTVSHNIPLGRYLKQYICRFCGQPFVYEDEEFEPIN